MANKIQVKRGVEANLPILDVAEPAFTTDTKKPFIGSDEGNVELATKEYIDGQVDTIVANATVDSEVILARDGKTTLNDRLEADKTEVLSEMSDLATQKADRTELTELESLMTNVIDGEIQNVLNNELVATDIANKLNAKEVEYAPRLTSVEAQINTLDIQLTDIIDDVEGIILKGVTVAPPTFANSIEDCTDIDKVYVLPDGYLYAYKKNIAIVSHYTNLVPTATSAPGGSEIYNEIGYTKDKYLSSETNAYGDAVGCVATGFIPCVVNSTHAPTIYVKGINLNYSLSTRCRLFFNKNNGALWNSYNAVANSSHYIMTEIDTNYYKFEPIITNSIPNVYSAAGGDLKAFRISGLYVDENIIVTIDEPIVDEEILIMQWENTGHVYQPTDYEDRIITLETSTLGIKNDITSLKVRVKSLEDASIFGGDIPEYVITESEEVADKVLAVRSADSFVMALASDFHTNGEDTSSIGVLHAGQGMDAINSMTQLDLVALLGDYEIYGFSYGDGDTDGEDARKSFKHVKKSFYGIAKSVPFMQLQGNHDEIPTDTVEEERQKYYAYIGANNIGTVTDYDNKFRNYGYKDFENYKIRVIYFNTSDFSDGGITGQYISQSQVEWMINTALNIEKEDASEWGVIALSHHPLNWSTSIIAMWTILDGFKGKKTGDIVIGGATIPYDFTSVASEFICHFHGHTHNFRAETIVDATHTEGITTITIPNACHGRNNEYGTHPGYSQELRDKAGDVDENGVQRQFNKTANTANDTAFNVVIVDRGERKVHCINYGAGIDREISY